MTIHSLKSWPKFFDPISAGLRMHELRRNDRDFRVGDRIELREFDPEMNLYTGRKCLVMITSITSAGEPCAVSEIALDKDFCILSVVRCSKVE